MYYIYLFIKNIAHMWLSHLIHLSFGRTTHRPFVTCQKGPGHTCAYSLHSLFPIEGNVKFTLCYMKNDLFLSFVILLARSDSTVIIIGARVSVNFRKIIYIYIYTSWYRLIFCQTFKVKFKITISPKSFIY